MMAPRHAFPLFSSFRKTQTLMILWLFTCVAFGAAISGDTNISNILNGSPSSNMTQMHDTFNSSVSVDTRYYCTQRRDWVPDRKGYEITDCFNARVKYRKNVIDTNPKGEKIEYFEFGTLPRTHLNKMQTPKRWTYGKQVGSTFMHQIADPGRTF